MKKVEQAVVLCAGNGARMRPFTTYFPKCMLPVQNNLALGLVLEELLAAKIKKIVFVINENQNVIADFVKNFFQEHNTKVQCMFLIQKIKNGGAGALLLCQNHLAKQPFLLVFSDDISNKNASKQIIKKFLKCKKNIMSIRFVTPQNAKNYGIIVPKKNRKNLFWLLGIIEKPKTPLQKNFANFGRYVLMPNVFDILPTLPCEPNGEIFLTKLFEKLIAQHNLLAYRFKGQAFDIGTPENYKKTFNKFKKNKK